MSPMSCQLLYSAILFRVLFALGECHYNSPRGLCQVEMALFLRRSNFFSTFYQSHAFLSPRSGSPAPSKAAADGRISKGLCDLLAVDVVELKKAITQKSVEALSFLCRIPILQQHQQRCRHRHSLPFSLFSCNTPIVNLQPTATSLYRFC